jgi:uncharacterized protein (TIGR02231 family)
LKWEELVVCAYFTPGAYAAEAARLRESLERFAIPAEIRCVQSLAGATWQPSYNARTAGVGQPVSLEYNALVQQASGEDWNGVNLTLSTAAPAMAAEAPILTPLWVTLTNGQVGWQPTQGGKGYVAQIRDNAGNIDTALRGRQAGGSKGEQVDYDWSVNQYAARSQLLEFNLADKDVLEMRDLVSGGGLSVSYKLDGPISVASRNDQQMLRVATLKLDGDFYYQASPLLTPYVYQQADLVNTSEIALLDGPVDSYLDGQFVGVGRVGLVARGQGLTIGFGVDSQLRAKRELVDKREAIRGGNKVLTFKYRILLDNYKDKPVAVRVLDRLPEPVNADIQSELENASVELSKDKAYQRSLKDKGILRWDVEVPGGSRGADAKAIDFEFSVAFDKNVNLAEPSAEMLEQNKRELMRELDRMQ